MQAPAKIAITATIMTFAIVALVKAQSDPVSRPAPTETVGSGADTSRNTQPLLFNLQPGTFPHVGTPINVFDPNGRVLRIVARR
jgi:hypothetical protein